MTYSIKNLLILTLLTAASGASAETTLFSSSTGVNGFNNNLLTTGAGSSAVTQDTNWQFEGFTDSYGLTRGQVFGSSVSNPNAAISGLISSPSATLPIGTDAYVVSGANRPGWYNPHDGAQWIAAEPKQANGGTPINPPGNYDFRLNLSSYINPNGGEVHVSIGEINADNHFEMAVGGSVAAKSFLLQPFATQETWNNAGQMGYHFNFSPKDGALLDMIVANNNDQLVNGHYAYDKNPTGFLIDHMVVTQDAGSAPARDHLTANNAIYNQIVQGSGPVNSRGIVAAPEPRTWLVLLSFLAVVGWQARNRSSASR